MREIKFRAWDKRTGKWLNNFRIYMHGNIELYAGHRADPEWQPYAKKHYELMQYTGLKDKNGKEIYEGDIIQSTWRPSDKFLIEWNEHEGEWCFCSDTNEVGGKYKGSVVIGNHYENPELLTNKD
jgi:uncharacterized phage protein (TIGR01671 family)